MTTKKISQKKKRTPARALQISITAREVRNNLLNRHKYAIDGLVRLSAGYQPQLPLDLLLTPEELPEFTPCAKSLIELLKAIAPAIALEDDLNTVNISSIEDVFSGLEQGIISQAEALTQTKLLIEKADIEDRAELLQFIRNSGVSL